MSEQEIEKEIQVRIEFKMNEFMTGLKNLIGWETQRAFHSTSHPKHSYRLDAMQEVQTMFLKEVSMGTPTNEMDKRKRWEAKEKAVDNITKSLDLRGRQDYQHKIRVIVSEIEKAQNY